jgi:hypothetical protein
LAITKKIKSEFSINNCLSADYRLAKNVSSIWDSRLSSKISINRIAIPLD